MTNSERTIHRRDPKSQSHDIHVTKALVALGIAEEVRIGKYVFFPDALRALVGSMLIRVTLAKLSRLQVKDIKIARTAENKPYWNHGKTGRAAAKFPYSLHFNLSHHGNWVLLALHPSLHIGMSVFLSLWALFTHLSRECAAVISPSLYASLFYMILLICSYSNPFPPPPPLSLSLSPSCYPRLRTPHGPTRTPHGPTRTPHGPTRTPHGPTRTPHGPTCAAGCDVTTLNMPGRQTTVADFLDTMETTVGQGEMAYIRSKVRTLLHSVCLRWLMTGKMKVLLLLQY